MFDHRSLGQRLAFTTHTFTYLVALSPQRRVSLHSQLNAITCDYILLSVADADLFILCDAVFSDCPSHLRIAFKL